MVTPRPLAFWTAVFVAVTDRPPWVMDEPVPVVARTAELLVASATVALRLSISPPTPP